MITGTRSLALVLFICLYNSWTKRGVEARIFVDQDVKELLWPDSDETMTNHLTRVDHYFCQFNPCLNGGTCHYLHGLRLAKRRIPYDDGLYGYCECPPSHFGIHCEYKVPGPRLQARKFFVSEITPSVPDDNINWNYATVVSYVRVTAPSGTVVTRIGLSDNGLQYTSYRKDTVPASGTLCILSLRDKRAILQAERDGVPLIPRQPTGLPLLVNPEIIDRSSVGNVFQIQSLRFTSTKADDRGPIYLKGEHGRCSQRGVNDFAFEFRDANVGQLFHWESIRIDDPNNPQLWQVRPDEICFVKARVVGTKPDSVIYVRSIGKAPGQSDVEYGYTAEKSATVGGQGVVCLEYRCNEGSSGQYQTHLQFLTLTGSCTVQRLNNVLNGAQNRCTVPPSSSSSQERNFCVPHSVGGDVGLYSGDTGVAKHRCLTGNQLYNSGRPTTTNLNPTVTIRCR